jgi:hypothetical protein
MQVARGVADDRVVEDRGIRSRQLPRLEERRPVDEARNLAEIDVAEFAPPGARGCGGAYAFQSVANAFARAASSVISVGPFLPACCTRIFSKSAATSAT